MDIKLIICDLDRTLRRNDGNISQYHGILLGFAATRTQMTAQNA